MNESTYAVIMAGGHGRRFWPISRKSRPKQLLEIVGEKSMIQQTVARIESLLPAKNILIITNKDQAHLIQDHLPQISPQNILAEPCSRNTSPALSLAAAYLMSKTPNSTMLVLASDHIIQKHSVFLKHLQQGIDLANKSDYLITLGIQPTSAETGYGYIQMDEPFDDSLTCFKVKRFVEKPDRKTAQHYLKEGGYLWNSGMFIWKTKTFWSALEQFLPSTYQSFQRLIHAWGTPGFSDTLNRVYQGVEAISVDYGIMEKSDKVLVIPTQMGWIDVGSWSAIDHILKKGKEGNIILGPHICIDTKNIIAYSPKKLIATIGVQDLIIVETEDALLICHKDQAQDVKALVSLLQKKGLDEYL